MAPRRTDRGATARQAHEDLEVLQGTWRTDKDQTYTVKGRKCIQQPGGAVTELVLEGGKVYWGRSRRCHLRVGSGCVECVGETVTRWARSDAPLRPRPRQMDAPVPAELLRNFSTRWVCLLCDGALRDPVVTARGNMFCSSCFASHVKRMKVRSTGALPTIPCPATHTPLARGDVAPLAQRPELAEEYAREAVVVCRDHRSRGGVCAWSGLPGEWHRHAASGACGEAYEQVKGRAGLPNAAGLCQEEADQDTDSDLGAPESVASSSLTDSSECELRIALHDFSGGHPGTAPLHKGDTVQLAHHSGCGGWALCARPSGWVPASFLAPLTLDLESPLEWPEEAEEGAEEQLPKAGVEHTAVAAFDGVGPGCMSLKVGDRVTVWKEDHSGWCYGVGPGGRAMGWFPLGFVERRGS